MIKSKYIHKLTKIIILFILLISFQQLTLSNSLNNFKYIGSTIYNHSNVNLTKLKNGQLLLTNGLVQLPIKYDKIGLENIEHRLEREQNSKYAEKFDPKTEQFKFAGESVINIIKNGGENKDIAYRLSDTSQQAITLNNGEVLVLWLCEGTAEIYNPNTEQFRRTGNLLKKRNSNYPAPTVQKLPDGRVIIISGSSKEAYNSAEIFDPKTEKFYDLGNLAVNRPYSSASLHSVLLNDGKILIWGGTIQEQSIFKNHKPITSMEVFEPKTNRFEYLGEIPAKYNFYNAITLDNGAVFFIGISKFLGKSNTYGVIYKEVNL